MGDKILTVNSKHLASWVSGISKDVRIVEDRALGIYPNSVYALYMTSLAAVLVLNSNNQH